MCFNMDKDAKKVLQISSAAVFFALIAGYALWGTKDLILGVRIKDVVIQESEPGILDISGNARNAVNIVLNGREISIDKEGRWRETIALLPGYNLIEIQAEDKFGNRDEKNYQLTHSPAENKSDGQES